MYDTVLADATQREACVSEGLKALGYTLGHTHTEYSKYDSNPGTDENWLWRGDFKNVGLHAALPVTPETCEPPVVPPG